MTKVRRPRLGDVMELRRDPIAIEASKSYRKIGIYSWGRGVIRYEPTAAAEMGSLRYFRFPKDAVVFSNIQAWEQAVAVSTAEDASDFVCSNRFLPYVGDPEEVDPRFIFHFMLSEPGHSLLLKASPGTQVRNRTLGKKLLEDSKIPLPDLPEQHRIATHLDRVARQIRALPQDVVDVRTALPRWINGVFSEAELSTVPIADLCTNINRTIHPGDDRRGATAFVGLEHIESHTGRRLSSRSLGEEKGRKLLFQEGEVTYGYLRPYLNKAWAADTVGLCSVEQYVLAPHDGVDPALLSYVLRAQSTLDAANEATNRLQLPRLRLASLMAFKVPDIHGADKELLARLDDLTKRALELQRLYAQRESLVASMLPAARNAVFQSLTD